jgi:hypothetical protein
MYERRNQKLASRRYFARRVARHTSCAFLGALAALGIGIIGYHYLDHLGWLDAFVDAAMILGGMGPVHPLVSQPAKVFAGVYALFAGVVFIAVSGVVIAPFVHRLLHHFHFQE